MLQFIGKWASRDPYDCLMDITEDGCVSVSFTTWSNEEAGDYDLRPNFSSTETTLSWSTEGTPCATPYSCELTLTDENTLEGEIRKKNGEPKRLQFVKMNGVAPVKGTPHRHLFDSEETVPAGFPLSAAELNGQWSSPVPWNTKMNFYADGDKVRLILHISSFFPPIDFFMEGNSIVWQINDARNRGRCSITWDGEAFVGTYTQIGHPKFDPVRFVKTSDVPEEIKETEPNIPLPDKSRIEILRENAGYGEMTAPVETEYRLGGEVPAVLAKYDYASYIEGKSGDDVAFACLNFICDHFHHYGSSGMPPYRTRALTDFISYCSEHENRTNCRGLSIMLADLLRLNGIRAAHITCMPYEDPFNDCHVVVDCHLPSGKRVMLDPTHRLWLYDDEGEMVSLPRLRQMLINGENLTPCSVAAYTGGPGGFDIDDYREYMSKNMLRFSKGRINEDGNDEREEMALCPKGYPADKMNRSSDCIVLQDPAAFWGE